MEVKKGIIEYMKQNIQHKFIFYGFPYYNSYYKAQVYNFDVWEEGHELEPKFSFILMPMENGRDMKSIDLLAGPYYNRKGISDAIILKAKELFNKRIISSSNKVKFHYSEIRKPDADRVWQRLVKKSLAEYDVENDYYYTL